MNRWFISISSYLYWSLPANYDQGIAITLSNKKLHEVVAKYWFGCATKLWTSVDDFANKVVKRAMRKESLGKIEIQWAGVIIGKICFLIIWKRSQQCWNEITLFIWTLFWNIREGSYQAIRLHHVQQDLLLGLIHTSEHMINKGRYQYSHFFKPFPLVSKHRLLEEKSTYKETC